jgi:putative hemolysin
VGTNLCIVVASVCATSVAEAAFGAWGQLGASIAMTVLLLTFGEYIPKAWFRSNPYQHAARFAHILEWAWRILKPIGTAVTWISGLLVPGRDSSREALCALATRAELKLLASEGERYGVITPEERTMIHRVIELSERTAGTIMVPLEQMRTVPAGTTLTGFLEIARQSEFTRFPVFSAVEKRFVGVIDLFDVLTAPPASTDPVDRFMRPPVLVQARTPGDEIVPALRHAHQPIGLVVDDAQTVLGLVTTDDVLRHIVGSL